MGLHLSVNKYNKQLNKEFNDQLKGITINKVDFDHKQMISSVIQSILGIEPLLYFLIQIECNSLLIKDLRNIAKLIWLKNGSESGSSIYEHIEVELENLEIDDILINVLVRIEEESKSNIVYNLFGNSNENYCEVCGFGFMFFIRHEKSVDLSSLNASNLISESKNHLFCEKCRRTAFPAVLPIFFENSENENSITFPISFELLNEKGVSVSYTLCSFIEYEFIDKSKGFYHPVIRHMLSDYWYKFSRSKSEIIKVKYPSITIRNPKLLFYTSNEIFTRIKSRNLLEENSPNYMLTTCPAYSLYSTIPMLLSDKTLQSTFNKLYLFPILLQSEKKMNNITTIVQSLLFCPILSNFLLNSTNKNFQSITGKLQLIIKLLSQSPKTLHNINDLVNQISPYYKEADTLPMIFDTLLKELHTENLIKTPEAVVLPEYDFNYSMESNSIYYWESLVDSLGHSIIVDIFYGLMKIEKKCNVCESMTVTYEKLQINLTIKQNVYYALDEAFKSKIKTECCSSDGTMEKKIIVLPKYLVISFDRNSPLSFISDKMEIPKILDLKNYSNDLKIIKPYICTYQLNLIINQTNNPETLFSILYNIDNYSFIKIQNSEMNLVDTLINLSNTDSVLAIYENKKYP